MGGVRIAQEGPNPRVHSRAKEVLQVVAIEAVVFQDKAVLMAPILVPLKKEIDLRKKLLDFPKPVRTWPFWPRQ